VWQPGDIERTHAEPAEGGYYKNWDPYAATVELTPASACNPTHTQHVLIATVKDKDGKPLPNRRVEWLIPDGSIGTFVEVDESGWRASRGHKVTNKYAITHTNNFKHTITRGNDDPSDDIELKPGQTWAVITSPQEGTTHVVAYVPAIYNWDKHKAFATKSWVDMDYKLPPDATNVVGTPHRLETRINRNSNGDGLEGYKVTYRVVSGPAGKFENGESSVTVNTNADGVAAATLNQVEPAEGCNEIDVQISNPEGDIACAQSGRVRKNWVAPKLACSKTGPEQVATGQEFTYNIRVNNPGNAPAKEVVLTDTLPEGLAYVSSNPEGRVSGQTVTWNLGDIEAGGSKSGSVTVRATRTGTFTNTAQARSAEGLTTQCQAVTETTAPRLVVAKRGPEEVLICDEINYTITIRNDGDAAATNVKVVDQLPEGLTTDGEQQKTWNLGTIESGQSKQVRLTAKAERPGEYDNRINVTADAGLNGTCGWKTVVRQPVLVVNKTAPAVRYVGRPATYEITVSSKGDAPAENTKLVDELPDNVKFVRASDGGQHQGGRVTWDLGTLAVNAEKKVTVTVEPTAIGEATNTATATARCAKASGETTIDVRGIPAMLLEVIDLVDPIEVGANVTYRITVTNQGSAPDRNVKVAILLADPVEYVSATGPTKATVDGKRVTFGTIDRIEPKGKATFEVVIKGTEECDTRFGVSLTSDTLTVPVQETESTHFYGDRPEAGTVK
jgi:uncharacterized repeat protein (TIGR01451 family)